MSGLKKAFDKLTHKDTHQQHGHVQGTATPDGLQHVDSAVNSPPHSGASTPVHEKPHHKSGGGSGLLHFGSKKEKTHDADGVARSNSLPRSSTDGCNDAHEHFKAIKKSLTGGGKHKDDEAGHRASSDGPARPGLVHHITEQDQRALKVDRQQEIQQEQLRRELAYKEAYEKDPLNGKYGFLNIDATPNAVDTTGKCVQPVAVFAQREADICRNRKQTFTEIAEKKEGDEVYFRARIQSVRHQSESSPSTLLRPTNA